MFTGIIRTIGIVKEMKNVTLCIAPKGLQLSQTKSRKKRLSLGRIHAGDSIAVNGVCLTVEELFSRPAKKLFSSSLMSSTLKTTTLGDLKKGDAVNLELPLRYGDRVDGHFVLGHVDGIGIITEIRSLYYRDRISVSRAITIRIPVALKKYCVAKDSIAFDGVSLTIVSVRGRDVLVSLTPYTLAHTRFANVLVGDRVNVEVDVLARYLQNKNIIRAKSRIIV